LSEESHTHAAELVEGICFRDPVAAARNLARLRNRLDAETLRSLPYVLLESPDPDSTIIRLERLLESVGHGLAADLTNHPNLLQYACAVFAHSAWLGETLVRSPEILQRAGDRMNLERSWACEKFREEFARFRVRSGGVNLGQALAHFRKREYIRILLRDVLGIAGIGEITAEISALSDALLEEAFSAVHAQLAQRYGPARWTDQTGRYRDSRYAVVSLGKLGGNELNYSSDVDLIFLYDGGVEAAGARTSNREYFIELAQRTTELLSRPTGEGPVFRIDLRLRPQGHEGELAVTLPWALRYYSDVAQDWELQAMIKARHSAGDPSLTREFIAGIAPFVYRPNLNFAAIKTALQSRERIDRRRASPSRSHSRGAAFDVKLDRGGIRDIEFLVQCLQRVYGGEEAWLRSRGTLFALQKLHDKEHLSGKDFHALSKAYEFLRGIEHHLQLRQGLQVHQLPADEGDLQVLAKSVSRGDEVFTSAGDFLARVRRRMEAVAEIYRKIVYHEQNNTLADSHDELPLRAETRTTSESLHSPVMRRLAWDAPSLLAAVGRASLSQHGRRNLNRFLDSAATSPERYASVLRSPNSIRMALKIFECSEYLSGILIRHPMDVELLQEGREEPTTSTSTLTPAGHAQTATELQAQFALRRRFRQATLMANARELYRNQDIWQTFGENSHAADRAIAEALAIARAPAGFAILALGRLGSSGFDVLSDADLLFVADDSADHIECRRAAERVTEVLTAYTREGTVFPVDPRLRPHGAEGDLVTTPGRLAAYFAREAKPWEAISYLRLRLVAGSREIADRAMQSVRVASLMIAQRPDFSAELMEMRRRLEASDGEPNFKTGPGGSYDIDFLVGSLQVRHGLWDGGNLAGRVRLTSQHGLLDAQDADELAANATFLRLVEHRVRLVTGRMYKWLPPGDHARSVLQSMAASQDSAQTADLEKALASSLRRNREIFLKYPF
jgi:[glutamine synthetase] adenylyltransferase / [glutamine synthetase]-adenylyl-L-tyrosine phosphorylase